MSTLNIHENDQQDASHWSFSCICITMHGSENAKSTFRLPYYLLLLHYIILYITVFDVDIL